MGQVTIYLDDATEEKARAAARAEGVPLSKWVAALVQRRARSEWPEAIRALAGAWPDLPSASQIRRLVQAQPRALSDLCNARGPA